MKKSNENTSLKYLELAKEKEEIGEYREALEYYKKSIEEDPDNIEAYFGLNLINSYIEMEKELKNDDSDNINKHIELFNIFNEFLDKKDDK
ncbi:tetratricopeptide repeat protein [Brachyspira intermedia]|uniref:tetratricopeptide repeat protein n=1 Tax=Brachyspira intermedia TaxID=84377 RepID=UPI0030045C37